MEDALLVVVHPGFAANRAGWIDGVLKKKYGNHETYLKRLEEAVYARKDCIMLMYKNDELPFPVPGEAEVLRYDDNRNTKLIRILKYREVERVDICGEFLWWYSRNVTFEEVRKITESLSKEKRTELENLIDKKGYLDFDDLKERGTFPKPFVNLLLSLFYSEGEVRDGCVKNVKCNLKDFSVNIARELCYPIKEPKKRL